MTIQELFITSNKALAKVVAQITDAQLQAKMPEISTRKPMLLVDAVRYHTYDDAWVPDVLAGKTKEEVGDSYEGLLTSDDVLAKYAQYNQRANDAVSQFTDLSRTSHLSYGDFSAKEYLQHIISFRVVRTYDIAKLIGVDMTVDEDYAQALLDEYSPVIESYRQMGVFPPALEVASDASPQTKLLAMFGRS